MKIWVTCEGCMRGNGKRAVFHGQNPYLQGSYEYKENEGCHGKWSSFDPIGWKDNTELPIEIGECKLFELVLSAETREE